MKLNKNQKEKLKVRLEKCIELKNCTWGVIFNILEQSLPRDWKSKKRGRKKR